MLAGHMSILVTTTNTGTLRARASPRCSLVMPTMPALLPTWGQQQRSRETERSSRLKMTTVTRRAHKHALTKSHPLSHHEHAEVRQVSGHAEDSGFEVLLVAGQVDEGNDLWGFLTDLGPVQAATVAVWLVHHLKGAESEKEYYLTKLTIQTYCANIAY